LPRATCGHEVPLNAWLHEPKLDAYCHRGNKLAGSGADQRLPKLTPFQQEEATKRMASGRESAAQSLYHISLAGGQLRG
jgi:hypothetical protein